MTPMTSTEWTQFERVYPRPPFDPEQQPEANLVPVALDLHDRVTDLDARTPAAGAVGRPFVVRMFRRVPLTIATGVYPTAKIPLDRVAFDTEGTSADLVNGRVVVRRAGYYQLSASAALKNIGTAIPRVFLEVVQYAGGGVIHRRPLRCEVGQYRGNQTMTKTVLVYLNVGDRLELGIFQDSGGNVSIEEEAEDYPPSLSLVEVWPTPLTPVVPLRIRPVVGVGDSNTEGTPMCDTNRVWGEYLTSQFTNLGVSGITTSQILANSASIISAANAEADFVLAAGVNDMGYELTPDIELAADNIKEILEVAAPLFRRLVWVTPSKVNYLNYANNAAIATDIALLIAAVQALAIPNLIIIRADQDAVLGATADDPVIYVDGLHYSPIAQERLAELIHAALPA